MNKPQDINVLIACEESQAECIAFRALGFNAFSCDLQKCSGGHKDWHIMGDVTPYLMGCTSFTTSDGQCRNVEHWHLIIAHPPCTYLCKVSAVQLYKDPDTYIQTIDGQKYINWERWLGLKEGRRFFFQCLAAKADYLAVENPIPMKIANPPHPSTYACPSWYGYKYSKKTLYWLRNLPPLLAGVQFPNPKCYTSSSRGKYRSRTSPFLANAIAHQWGDYILDDLSKKSKG